MTVAWTVHPNARSRRLSDNNMCFITWQTLERQPSAIQLVSLKQNKPTTQPTEHHSESL